MLGEEGCEITNCALVSYWFSEPIKQHTQHLSGLELAPNTAYSIGPQLYNLLYCSTSNRIVRKSNAA